VLSIAAAMQVHGFLQRHATRQASP